MFSPHKKKWYFCDVRELYGGNHIAVYKGVKSTCTPKLTQCYILLTLNKTEEEKEQGRGRSLETRVNSRFVSRPS